MNRHQRGLERDERTLFRAVYEELADDPIPSRSARGRFHDVDAIGGTTTYLAATSETAWKEVTSNWGIAKANPAAYRMCEIIADVEEIVDLTEPTVQEKYGVDRDTLTAPDHGKCRELAARLRQEGVEAAWAYSAADAPAGRVLVVFLDRLGPDSEIRVRVIRELEFEE